MSDDPKDDLPPYVKDAINEVNTDWKGKPLTDEKYPKAMERLAGLVSGELVLVKRADIQELMDSYLKGKEEIESLTMHTTTPIVEHATNPASNPDDLLWKVCLTSDITRCVFSQHRRVLVLK